MTGRGRARAPAGLANRPLDEEIRQQELLPARGRRHLPGRASDRPLEPAPVRQRGRGADPELEVPSSTIETTGKKTVDEVKAPVRRRNRQISRPTK